MQKKKDVLFLCQFFYPEYISSATLPYDTAKAVKEAGFSVGVMCGYPKEYCKNDKKVLLEEDHNGIKIKRLKYLQAARNNIVGRLINYFSFTFSALLKLKLFKNYKAIIVYTNPPILPLVALIANKVYKIKLILVSFDVYPEIAIKTKVIREKSIICRIMRLINDLVFKNIDKVVVISNDMKEFLLKNRKNLRDNQIAVIPNWHKDEPVANINRSQSNNLFKQVISDGKFVVSYFGNMGIAQDLKTLLDAIRYFTDDDKIVFLFAGHGKKLPFLKKVVNDEFLDNVFIYDYLHGDDYKDALNISDLFIVSLEEGLTGLAVPSKTYSYMMAGKPIVAIMGMDSDIIKDLNANNAGYGIEIGNVNGLIEAIESCKRDSDKKLLMGKNARRLFEEKYNTQKCTLQYVNLIRNLLEEHPNV